MALTPEQQKELADWLLCEYDLNNISGLVSNSMDNISNNMSHIGLSLSLKPFTEAVDIEQNTIYSEKMMSYRNSLDSLYRSLYDLKIKVNNDLYKY